MMTQQHSPSHALLNSPQADVLVHRTERSPVFLPVDRWRGLSDPIKTLSDGGSTRYAGQIIIQLENDPVVHQAAVRLTEKHPNSVLLQLDELNQYRVLAGSPGSLRGKLRWQVVGHGSGSHTSDLPAIGRMSGMTPAGLAALLKNFNQHFSTIHNIDMTPNRISLVGCRLIRDLKGENFATQFARAMKRKGITAEISARKELVSVGRSSGKKFTHKTKLVKKAQTAGDTLLLGWNQKGELIPKKHSSAFRLLYPVLSDWSPEQFTDPKIKSRKFKYLVYPASMKDFTSRQGIFSKNIQDKLEQSDVIHASLMSNKNVRAYTVGLILEVPEQNILAAAPDEKIIETHLKNPLTKPIHDSSSKKNEGFKPLNQIIHAIGERLVPTISPELAHQALLSNQLFSYPQRVATPDEILEKTMARNTVLITGKTDINLYPNYPVTKKIKITGLFLICSDDPQNTQGASNFDSQQPIAFRNLDKLQKFAQDVTQELGVELTVLKIRHNSDLNAKGHQKDTPAKISQTGARAPLKIQKAQKNRGSSLEENLRQVWTLINDLSSRKKRLFSSADFTILTDFFHLPSGEPNWNKLYQTVSDPLLYSQFTTQIQSLLQLSDTHDQLRGLTGQDALKQIADWDNFVVDNMVNWNKRIKSYTHVPGLITKINPGMQAIYMNDGSELAQKNASKLSLAYLSLVSLNHEDLRLKLFQALKSHAQINEQKIFSQSADHPAKIFGSLIRQLEDRSAFVKKGKQSLSQFLDTFSDETTGYYQLRMGKHLLTIGRRKIADNNINGYLYDANFGEISMTGVDAQTINTSFKLILNDYFTCLIDSPQKEKPFLLEVDQFNPTDVLKSNDFKKLQIFMKDLGGTSTPSSQDKPIKKFNNISHSALSKVSRTLDASNATTQGILWVRTLSYLSHYWRRHHSEKLTQQQKQAIDLEVKLAIAGLVYDVGSLFLDVGFRKMGAHLVKKFFSLSFLRLTSRMQRLQYAAGLKLARYGSTVFSIAGAGFDIYQAQKISAELQTELDPNIRKDLKVSLTLSYVGASMTLKAALASLVLTGKMALAANVIGAALGILIAVGGVIYYAVRQVEEIERYTRLTTLQRLRSGWFSFLGAEVDVEVINQVTKEKAAIEAKKNLDQQFKRNFETLLESDDEIEAIYYSTGKLILKEHPYKKLVGKTWTMLGNRPIPQREYLFNSNIKDKILPSEFDRIISDYKTQMLDNQPLYIDLDLKDSEYKFYDITGLSPTDDRISLNDQGDNSEDLLWLKRPVGPSSDSLPQLGSVVTPDIEQGQKTSKIYFFLGEGNDEIVGHPGKINIFDVRNGVKNFKGGNQSDIFIFSGTTPPPTPSVLEGVKGSNLLIAHQKPSKGGYYINLNQNAFHFTHPEFPQKIATLQNISHIETCAETDDTIFGNDEPNYLNGKGGQDKLLGFDGNDILVAQAGKLCGGKGDDFYRVLQNNRSTDAILVIEEEDSPEALSHVLLDYSVTDMISIKRVNQDLLIELMNKNKTKTTLKLSYLYPLHANQAQRVLATQYIFYTQDGMILMDLPYAITLNSSKEQPEWISLKAQYAPNFDQTFTLAQSGSIQTPLIIQKMPYQTEPGLIHIHGEKRILPDFLKLLLKETGFNDDLQGDDFENILRSTTGQDVLEGKGGKDVYIVEDRPGGNQVTINNYDAPETSEPERDILLLPFLIDEIEITQDDDDVIISHLDTPEEQVSVRLINFMVDESHRHLSMIDKNGRVHTLTVNDNHEPRFIAGQLIPQKNEVNDDSHYFNQLRQFFIPESGDRAFNTAEIEQIFHLSSDKMSQTMIPL